jgi:hypothetical protein
MTGQKRGAATSAACARSRGWKCCAVLLLWGVAACAIGFTYAEHRDVSNQGLRLALAYCEAHPERCRAVMSSQLKNLECFAGVAQSAGFPEASRRLGCPVTYGDLAALVDYTTDPFDVLYSKSLSVAILEEAAPDVQGALEILDLRYIERLRSKIFILLHASHLDDNHFQDRALAAFWFWHRMALSFADGSRINIFVPLIINAYANHFLEDFFAPGHMRTPRRLLHDAAAMAYHDEYNRVGQTFRPGGRRELEGLIQDAALWLRLDSQKGVMFYGDGRLRRNPNGTPLLTETWERQANQSNQSKVTRGEQELAANDLTGVPGVAGALDEHGDQYNFISALVALSVLDLVSCKNSCDVATEGGVTGAAYNGALTNSFEGVEWKAYRVVGKQTYTPYACLKGFGCYFAEPVSNPLQRDVLYGLTVGGDMMAVREASSGRGRVGMEIIPIWHPPPGWREQATRASGLEGLPQYGFALGYSYVFSGSLVGHGPEARLIVPGPAVDFQFSVGGGYRWYQTDSGRAARWHGGARLEFGYGLVFVGVGVERDYGAVASVGLRPGWAISSNLSFLVPSSLFRRK